MKWIFKLQFQDVVNICLKFEGSFAFFTRRNGRWNCLLTRSTRENNRSQHLTWKKRFSPWKNIRYLTQLHFSQKSVHLFNALYLSVLRKLIFIFIIILFIQILCSFFVCLALGKLFAFRTRSEWSIFLNFLINKLDSKSTLYFFCKSIEVSCEIDRRIAFAISAASLRFPISMNLLNKLFFALRRFVISSGLIFWICKSQKQVSRTKTDLLLSGTNIN